MTFDKIIQQFRDAALSKRDLGTKFEILMKNYLMTDPKFADQFMKVYLWSDFPFRT